MSTHDVPSVPDRVELLLAWLNGVMLDPSSSPSEKAVAQAIAFTADQTLGVAYHSWASVAAIAGVAEVLTAGRPDPKNPKSAVVDLKFVMKIDPPVGLREIKESHLFDDWALVRQSRLSTMQVPEKFLSWMRQRYEL